ncbi:hypothetical protein F4818DRAFT_167325 [Hypoxylon cercidicola]|nr:hypothetical protein F4818DRAFT_167325 [Hypoxylon cercidicola]
MVLIACLKHALGIRVAMAQHSEQPVVNAFVLLDQIRSNQIQPIPVCRLYKPRMLYLGAYSDTRKSAADAAVIGICCRGQLPHVGRLGTYLALHPRHGLTQRDRCVDFGYEAR